MNTLEKALLIKELSDLSDGLSHRALSFFEIAYSRNRLKDIFELCDTPIFKKQIINFKARTQPEIAAHEFAQQSPYYLSFRGFFTEDHALEDALYLQPHAGWGLLHNRQLGWQIWLIPFAHRTAIISEWDNLQRVYEWLLEQQEELHCLLSDEALKQRAVALELPKSVSDKAHTNFKNRAHPSSVTLPSAISDDVLHQNLTQDTVPPSKSTISLEKSPNSQSKPRNVFKSIQLNQLQGYPRVLEHAEHILQDVYALEIKSQAHIHQFLDIMIVKAQMEDWQKFPVYVIEQTTKKGKFNQYLMLLGLKHEDQALDYIQTLSQALDTTVIALKQFDWSVLSDCFYNFEALFHCYQQTTALWQEEDYLPFMPYSLIDSPQKFLQFKEKPAYGNTPLLLLQEHHKIRIIHGERRLALFKEDIAYPYILLPRQQGLNWQSIQGIVNTLQQPIDVADLLEAIQQNILGDLL